MTTSISTISNTNTFEYWLDKTNEAITALNTEVLTINTNAPAGNIAVNIIAANVALRGGNTTTAGVLTISSNTVLGTGNTFTIGTSADKLFANTTYLSVGNSVQNTAINKTQISVGNSTVNTVINTTSISFSGSSINPSSLTNLPVSNTITTTGTGVQILDTVATSSVQGVEYLITMKNNSANAYQMSKVLVLHDGGTTVVSEYGLLVSNSSAGVLGTFDSDVSGSDLRLLCTPSVSNATVKITRIDVKI